MAHPSETETLHGSGNSNNSSNEISTNENAMAIIASHSSSSSAPSSHRPPLSPLDTKQEQISTSPSPLSPAPVLSSSPPARSSSTPSFCGSSASYSSYSPSLSSPYPIVHSSPSPIDLARSSPSTIPPEQPQLYSSPFSFNQYTVEDPTVVDPLSSTLTPMASYPPLQSIANPPPLQPTSADPLPQSSQQYLSPQQQQQQRQPYPPPVDTTEPSRPRSVIDFALDGAGPVNPAGRRVRRNILTRLGALPRNSRIVIIFSALMMLIKVSATVVVLILDSKAEDVMLLNSLVILYALKSVVSLPFTLFAHMNPRRQGEPLTPRDILMERYRTLMEIAGTCLFFLSNYFLFSKPTWRYEAPATFFLCVANVAIGYIVILIPVLLCLAVILCLPLVVRVMRYLDIGPVVGIKGATEEMIAAIPIVIYRKPVETGAEPPSAVVDMGNSTPSDSQGERVEPVTLSSSFTSGHSPSPSSSSPSQPTPSQPTPSSVAPTSGRSSKGGFLGFFRKGKKQAKGPKPSEATSSTPAIEYLTLSDAQDAVCAICLCDYEDDEELRKMACTHYFHKECVDEWLRLHKNCPLCKRDIEDLAGVASGSSGSGSASRSPTSR